MLDTILDSLRRVHVVSVHADYHGDHAPHGGTMVEVFPKGTPEEDFDVQPPLVRLGFDSNGNLTGVSRDSCHYCN